MNFLLIELVIFLFFWFVIMWLGVFWNIMIWCSLGVVFVYMVGGMKRWYCCCCWFCLMRSIIFVCKVICVILMCLIMYVMGLICWFCLFSVLRFVENYMWFWFCDGRRVVCWSWECKLEVIYECDNVIFLILKLCCWISYCDIGIVWCF